MWACAVCTQGASGTRQEGSRLGVRVSERPREGSSAGRGRKVGVLARWGLWARPWDETEQGCLGAFVLHTGTVPNLSTFSTSNHTRCSLFYCAGPGMVWNPISTVHPCPGAPRGKPYSQVEHLFTLNVESFDVLSG